MVKETYLDENISIREYLLHHAKVGDRVDIYNSGYYEASCVIDWEDLFIGAMNRHVLNTYIDSVTIETVMVVSEDGTQTEERRIRIDHGFDSWTDQSEMRIAMKISNQAGSVYNYTKWYKEKDSKAMWAESDKIVENLPNWSRDVEYRRHFRSEE